MKTLIGVLVTSDQDAAEKRAYRLFTELQCQENVTVCLIRKNAGTPIGFGGLQKIVFRQAINQEFDAVTVIEESTEPQIDCLNEMVDSLGRNLEIDFVIQRPPQKTFGAFIHFISDCCFNLISGVRVRGWNSPLIVFRTSAIQKIAYNLNTHDAHFGVEVLLQLTAKGAKGSTCFASRQRRHSLFLRGVGLRSFTTSLRSCLKYRLEKYNLFYDIRFHPETIMDIKTADPTELTYSSKFDSDSPHAKVCNSDLIKPKSEILDIGCAQGYVAQRLFEDKQCNVVGVDQLMPGRVHHPHFVYHQLDIDSQHEKLRGLVESHRFDTVLLLDVLEHLTHPEQLLVSLHDIPYKQMPHFLISTGNVAFIVVRMMLLLGFFNYGKRGILDITHRRLFSLRSFRNLLEQTGYIVSHEHYFPFPFLALGFPCGLSKICESINRILIRLWPSVFAYQVMVEAVPLSFETVAMEFVGGTYVLPPGSADLGAGAIS